MPPQKPRHYCERRLPFSKNRDIFKSVIIRTGTVLRALIGTSVTRYKQVHQRSPVRKRCTRNGDGTTPRPIRDVQFPCTCLEHHDSLHIAPRPRVATSGGPWTAPLLPTIFGVSPKWGPINHIVVSVPLLVHSYLTSPHYALHLPCRLCPLLTSL